MVNLESRERATSSCAANSTPPSLSPPPLDQPHAAAHLPLQKYTPYKFDAPPLKESSNNTVEIKPFKASMSDSRVAGPLLLAALESMGEGGDEQSEQGGSSQDGMQRPSLSPNNYSTNSSERTSETSVSGSRDAENGSTANPDSASFQQNQSSAYSHPAYNNSLQHPLYSRPVGPSSSSTYSLPPINRASYAPYNYQSPYSRPLSSSGPKAGSTNQVQGTTTLPPLNMAVFSASAEPSFRPPPNLASPIGATNPSSYAQPSSLNPYNHPAYASSSSSHTFQHPAYARASAAQNAHFAPPLPAPPTQAPSTSSNPYSHPALPPPAPSNNFATPTSPWSGPPPPPLSMSAGSLLAKRRRSDTAGPTLHGYNGSNQAGRDDLNEEDELDEELHEDKERGTEKGNQKRRDKDFEENGTNEELQDEEAEDGDEEELAPQVKSSRPTKRARTASAKASETTPRPPPEIRPDFSKGRSQSPVLKSKSTTKSKTKPEKRKEPPEKKFICPHPACGRAFARHFNLNSHIKSHQGIREFKCPECSKLFSRKHDCTRHCVAIHGYDRESGNKGPIHEPWKESEPSRNSDHLSPAPSSPPPVSQPLPPAASLLQASGTSTSENTARQSLETLLQQTDSTDPNDSSTSSTSTAPS